MDSKNHGPTQILRTETTTCCGRLAAEVANAVSPVLEGDGDCRPCRAGYDKDERDNGPFA